MRLKTASLKKCEKLWTLPFGLCMLAENLPYTYLVDVLQRVADHPKSEIHQLTPVNWKKHFADKPRGSLIDIIGKNQ